MEYSSTDDYWWTYSKCNVPKNVGIPNVVSSVLDSEVVFALFGFVWLSSARSLMTNLIPLDMGSAMDRTAEIRLATFTNFHLFFKKKL